MSRLAKKDSQTNEAAAGDPCQKAAEGWKRGRQLRRPYISSSGRRTGHANNL